MFFSTGDLCEEGLGEPRMPSPPNCENVEEMRREIQVLTYTLECEKKIRNHLETRLKHMESPHSGSEQSFDVALQDHASYHITEVSIAVYICLSCFSFLFFSLL